MTRRSRSFKFPIVTAFFYTSNYFCFVFIKRKMYQKKKILPLNFNYRLYVDQRTGYKVTLFIVYSKTVHVKLFKKKNRVVTCVKLK